MKGFDILHAKSAVKTHSKLDLSHSHLTTMDFGQIVPLLTIPTIAGDKFNVKGNFFSRMSPLVKPTYGKFYFKTVTAFVPLIQLADDIEGWLAGKVAWEGTTPNSRYVTYFQFVDFIMSDVGTPASSTDTEYTVINTAGNLTYWKFVGRGKYILKVLNALGYALPQNVDLRSTSTWYAKFANKNLSLLPILAFAKVYNDYMSQSQRFNTNTLTATLRRIKHNQSFTGYNNSTCQVDWTVLKTIFDNILLNYENDYFTSAWQVPNQPITGSLYASSHNVPGDLSATPGSQDQMWNDQYSTYLKQDTNDKVVQRSLDYLKAFDDWVRRNNYSGSRAVQNIYARFGIKTDDYRSNYAHIIKTNSTGIQVGDVTQMAPTSTTKLGDYAGKGIMNDGNSFSFQASDYGYLFVLGYYTVAPMMSYGMDRDVMRVDPFEFYNPEFDGLGADAISFGEVFSNPIPDSTDITRDDSVYGFTERYNSYRYARDRITGEFRSYKNSDPNNTWHTGRLLNDVRKNNQMVAQSSAMNTLPQFDSEYDRIFSVVTGVDNFYLSCYFDISAIRPMLSLNQTPRLGEGDVVVPKNGNTIN